MNEYPVRCQYCQWTGHCRGKPTQYPPKDGRHFPGMCPKCGNEQLRLDLEREVVEAMSWPDTRAQDDDLEF